MRSLMRGLKVIRGCALGTALGPARANDDAQAVADALAAAARADTPSDRIGTLVVDFSRFDTWYEIDSFWEGRFLERTKKGAFKRTIERSKRTDGRFDVRVLFNHGFDMFLHNKALSVPEVLEERDDSPHLEGPLFRGTPELIVEGLRQGAYGSSFMFEVVGEEWNREPERSDYNPEGLPERTITEVRLFEAGPVTWPANPGATAGLRSGVDWYAEQLLQRDQEQYEELVRSFTAFRALNGLGDSSRDGSAPPAAPEPTTPAPGDQTPARPVDGVSAAARARRLALIDLARR